MGPPAATTPVKARSIKSLKSSPGSWCKRSHGTQYLSRCRRVRRPRDVMIPYLGPELLSVYLRCHNSGGRQSVATSIDGKPRQKGAGLSSKEPLNHYLTGPAS